MDMILPELPEHFLTIPLCQTPPKERKRKPFSRMRWRSCEHNTLVQWFLIQKNPFPKKEAISSFVVLFNMCRDLDKVDEKDRITNRNVKLWFQNQRQRLRDKLVSEFFYTKEDVENIMRYDPRHEHDVGTRVSTLLGWEVSTLHESMLQKVIV